MLAREIKRFVQEPILNALGWTDEASKLIVYGTGYVESHYNAIMQRNTPTNGGISFYQIQPSDYADILIWFRNGFNKKLCERILDVCNFKSFPSDAAHLAYNIAYATIICRVHYHRIKQRLPPLNTPDTARLYAEYHYKFYNGNGEGKADIEKNTEIFQRIINNEI